MKRPRQLELFGDFDSRLSAPAPALSEPALVALSLALGARDICGWSDREEQLCRDLPSVPTGLVLDVRNRIIDGQDPLGESFSLLRPPAERRSQGATFTPYPIIEAMLDWVGSTALARVVDPGAGSGRFAIRAGQRFRDASILGIEIDPLPAIIARANLAVSGLARRARIILADYRHVAIPAIVGRTLFIGNPPYVRHHLLDQSAKRWLAEEAAKLAVSASGLAGLHVYFFLATLAKGSPGDLGVFITAAEWLDVNYGSLVRELFLGGLGGKQIFVVDPKASPFPDADTTAAVTSFEIGSQPQSIRLKRVETVAELTNSSGGRLVRRERLECERRWSHLTRTGRKPPAGYIELGEICRVHRGQVTGANKLWIEGPLSKDLPKSVLFPTITRARELFAAGTVLSDASLLKRVIDLPEDLDVFDACGRRAIARFLAAARKLGAHETYVAANRRAWWSVGLREPAPVLATYMARRPPAFVRNLVAARHLNIAHGLYPREKLGDTILRNLVSYLSRYTSVIDGRTYAGGLTKFEPREMERLFVPSPEVLAEATYDHASPLEP